MKQGGFRTLTGYRQAEENHMTEAMEDYLEMICRAEKNGEMIRTGDLATLLHVRPSSASRMILRLTEAGLLQYEKYGVIQTTVQGRSKGQYLLWRHEVLEQFFRKLNQTEDVLKQVEQVEHFMTAQTIRNLEKLTQKI